MDYKKSNVEVSFRMEEDHQRKDTKVRKVGWREAERFGFQKRIKSQFHMQPSQHLGKTKI